MIEDNDIRRKITFAQAEGVEALPTQLAPKVVSKPLRARLLKILLESLTTDRRSDQMGYSKPWVGGSWQAILYDLHVLFNHDFADEYVNRFDILSSKMSAMVKNGSYIQIFGTLQFILRHPSVPHGLAKDIEWALTSTQAAYRLLDNDTIVPIGSIAEGEVIDRAFIDLRNTEFNGARKHLQDAGAALTVGNWADSVRESIHAVEAVVRMIDPKNQVDGALARLASAGHIHAAVRSGMGKLYNYTSDQPGIRHPLLDEGDANVDEADALYMFGACAAFVSYLIAKARIAKLVP